MKFDTHLCEHNIYVSKTQKTELTDEDLQLTPQVQDPRASQYSSMMMFFYKIEATNPR